MMNLSLSFARSRVLAASLLFFTAGFAQAQAINEIFKLEPSDAALDDDFGFSIAISGATAIVGSLSHDHNGGVNQGAAYLFDTITGLEIAELLPTDGGFFNAFGHSVAISGTTAIVGASRDGENGAGAGAAYLFDTTTGLQIAKLLANDGVDEDRFGSSVAISGTIAIVGAPGIFFSSPPTAGSAYLFDTTTGLQVAKLLANDGAVGDRFGDAVSISGTTAIVGAERDNDFGIWSGSAYLFDTTTGSQQAKLLPNDGDARDEFGSSVGISGTTAVVGAFGDGDDGQRSGSAYLFDTSTGLQVAKLHANDASLGDYFGRSVGISGTTVIVGAPFNEDNGEASGSAYLFDATTGSQVEKLLPSNGDEFHRFGESVAISGEFACVGAPVDLDVVSANSGFAYVFDALLHSLSGDVLFLSLGSGGSLVLSLDGGLSRAGWFYFMFGSVTGTAPGIDFGGGVVLPLNFDAYLNLTLTSPGLGLFGNFRSTLDGAGKAIATVSLPPIIDPSLVGVKLNHAYLAAAALGGADFASDAVPVVLFP